jgi:hypothetical protein
MHDPAWGDLPEYVESSGLQSHRALRGRFDADDGADGIGVPVSRYLRTFVPMCWYPRSSAHAVDGVHGPGSGEVADGSQPAYRR